MPNRLPPSPDDVRDLELVLKSHHPLLYLETLEDERALTLVGHVADRLDLPVFVWQPHRGLRRLDANGPMIVGTDDPGRAVAFVEEASQEAVYVFFGFDAALREAAIVARLKDVHRRLHTHRGAMALVTHAADLPPELVPLFTRVALRPPSDLALHRFLSDIVRDLRKRMPVHVELSQEDVGRLIANLRGLTLFEVQKVITKVIVEDGRLDASDIATIIEAKRELVRRAGVLEFFPREHSLDDVAGLPHLKAWLRKRTGAFREPERARRFGIEPPRGVLLLGVQGCGKSLAAKAVADAFGLPLLRLDPSRVYQKYVGESEKNLERAIKAAEALAPVVLWIDEMEKAFADSGSSDGGAGKRVFGTFISWLQEKKQAVFVIATANDVRALPPELLRKGRFDEIFFVDLPDELARAAILEVHLTRRGRDPAGFDLGQLARASDGFSGAELEQAIVSALYAAFADGGDLDTRAILHELRTTRPLSVTMAERIAELRAWARDRAVPA